MDKSKKIWFLAVSFGLTGCITQLQEVPTHYAAAPPVATVIKEPEPPPPPAVKKEEPRPDPAPVAKGKGAWTPAPKLNDGFVPEVTTTPIPADKAPAAVDTGKEENVKKEPLPPAVKSAPPVVKAPVKEVAPPPPPPGKVAYFVRLGSTANRGEAEKLTMRAQNELDLSVKEELLLLNGKKMYQVNAGPFTSQQQANDVARRLKEQEKINGEVFYVPIPAQP